MLAERATRRSRVDAWGTTLRSRSPVREGVRAWRWWSNGGVEQYVDAIAADHLMASKEAFALVASDSSGRFRGRVPGLYVQLDALDLGHGQAKVVSARSA